MMKKKVSDRVKRFIFGPIFASIISTLSHIDKDKVSGVRFQKGKAGELTPET